VTTKGQKFLKLTATQVVAIDNLLRDLCSMNIDGYAFYAEGWSDAKVATQAIPDYTGNGAIAVSRVRKQLGYGSLRRGRPVGGVARLDGIEGRLARVEAIIRSTT